MINRHIKSSTTESLKNMLRKAVTREFLFLSLKTISSKISFLLQSQLNGKSFILTLIVGLNSIKKLILKFIKPGSNLLQNYAF